MIDAPSPELITWEGLAPRYDELMRRAAAPNHVADWVAAWSRLSEEVREAGSRLSIRRSQDTEDEARRSAYLVYLKEVVPHVLEAEHALKTRLLETGWSAPGLDVALERFATEVQLFRAENLPLLAEERALASDYGQVVGGLTVEFDGASKTLAQLTPYASDPDRAVREGAYRAGAEAMLTVRGRLDELFDELFALRQTIAANAGCDSYTTYKWRDLERFAYSQADAETFHDAILKEAVPVLAAAKARRAEALGLETLRPWDMEVDMWGGSPLRPFSTGEELASGSAAIFAALDPLLGARVRTMMDEGLLDLDNRKGKAPGGYCATLSARRLPFIFMNAVGTEDNVRTMLHEAGHAFHVFDRSQLPYVWQRQAPMEFAEVASMSMELLTSPYLEKRTGGFYDRRDALRSRAHHLDRMVQFLPYMATVSRFQHRLYAPDGPRSAAERDAVWRDLYLAYNVGTEWDGLDDTLNSLWHHKLHIFQVPFYYIEYGLAQLGALQVWRNSLDDPDAALAQYRTALALGDTVPLPELFAAAGARFLFDAAGVAELLGLVQDELAALHEELATLDA